MKRLAGTRGRLTDQMRAQEATEPWKCARQQCDVCDKANKAGRGNRILGRDADGSLVTEFSLAHIPLEAREQTSETSDRVDP